MALACNIDNRGRALRLGLAFILFALAIGAWAGGSPWKAAGTAALGGFTLFEGVRGWCALKAVYPKFPV